MNRYITVFNEVTNIGDAIIQQVSKLTNEEDSETSNKAKLLIPAMDQLKNKLKNDNPQFDAQDYQMLYLSAALTNNNLKTRMDQLSQARDNIQSLIMPQLKEIVDCQGNEEEINKLVEKYFNNFSDQEN